ncbi:MAG: hypothetical protein HY650_04430 [Acidobacteria bacterium]|nr:hypothetical protein [Acidobacteriota bacterium]
MSNAGIEAPTTKLDPWVAITPPLMTGRTERGNIPARRVPIWAIAATGTVAFAALALGGTALYLQVQDGIASRPPVAVSVPDREAPPGQPPLDPAAVLPAPRVPPLPGSGNSRVPDPPGPAPTSERMNDGAEAPLPSGLASRIREEAIESSPGVVESQRAAETPRGRMNGPAAAQSGTLL